MFEYGTSGSASSSRRGSRELEAGDGSSGRSSAKLLKSISSADSRDSQSLSQGVLIGGFGSFALVVNNISGPGMLDFPQAFQAAGWAVAVPTIVAVACASAAVASSLASVHKIDRDNKGKDVEFCELFGDAYGAKVFGMTQGLYFLNLFSQNLAAIVTTAQAMDSLFAAAFGSSKAVVVAPLRGQARVVSWRGCSVEGCIPFDDAPPGVAFTAGYAFCLLTLGPLGFVTLRENMFAQKVSFVLLLVLCLQFLMYFTQHAGRGEVRAVGSRPWDVVGVVIFNFAFCVTVPSWLNEKRRRVSAKKTIWASCLTSAVGYCAVGWLGGLAFACASDNVLTELTAAEAPVTVRMGGGLFAFFIIGLGVPVFCVLMRYNLVAGGVSELWSVAVGGVGPWMLSWLFYRGHGILVVLAWSGLILNAGIDFIAPMLLVLKTAESDRDRKRAAALLAVVSCLVLIGLGLKMYQGLGNLDPVMDIMDRR